MTTAEIYAHTPGDTEEWHLLAQHLQDVALAARKFAEPFGGGDLAEWAALWHDLGKANPKFQDYLKAQHRKLRHPKVPHAIWGAALAYEWIVKVNRKENGWQEVAMPIAGHHGGLPDGGTIASTIERFRAEHPEALPILKKAVQSLPRPPALPPVMTMPTRRELFLRMAFSAVVDADYLDTERHFHPGTAALRGNWPTLDELSARFEQNQLALLADARKTDSDVNDVRREIYEACVNAAGLSAGRVYCLTAPTGGGKTRSVLAFALKHAVQHGLERIVMAVPYTSIIDQTAQIYRAILGDESLLEHHSQVQAEDRKAPRDSESEDPQVIALQLSAENWDAPLVVTTTVQLFESLLSDRPGRTRKLHNLARSVIILDEAQTLPVELLEPTLDVLRTLVEQYHVTLVLCTATQPAFDESPYLKSFHGMPVVEMVSQYASHFKRLRRVRYEIIPEPLSWEEIAEQIGPLPQAVVVLNTRKNALALFKALGEGKDLFHLSTLLCGAHRKTVLDEVRTRLRNKAPIRLISTQVIEAGVDLDFPVAWRALGPLDRIIQAAGRCNREGTRTMGTVVIFAPAEGGAPKGPYRVGMEETKKFLERYDPEELHNLDRCREYFQALYAGVSLDKKNIQSYRAVLNYPKVAEEYRLIDSDTVPVVVNYGDGLGRLGEWEDRPKRETWRHLQPFIVNMYRTEAQPFMGLELKEVTENLYVWEGEYHERLGLVAAMLSPSDLFV